MPKKGDGSPAVMTPEIARVREYLKAKNRQDRIADAKRAKYTSSPLYKKRHAEYNKKYREEHHEEILQKKRIYYKENIDKIIAYRRKTVERTKMMFKKYYEAHKEQIKAKTRHYYKTHRVELGHKKRIYVQKHPEMTRRWRINYYYAHFHEHKIKRLQEKWVAAGNDIKDFKMPQEFRQSLIRLNPYKEVSVSSIQKLLNVKFPKIRRY